MSTTPFTPKERALLLYLMALGGTASNPELKQRLGTALDGPSRLRLNKLDLVESVRPGRAFHHTLTEAGWSWCVDELSHTAPRSDPLGRTLYGVLGLLKGYLDASDLSLAEFVLRARATGADVSQEIRSAYGKLAEAPQDWVKLARLRALLPGTPREAVDEALRELERQPGVHLAPEADQKTLTDADREAAVLVGGVAKHLLAIETP
ncbi:MAG: hypothetical protein HOY71_25070 [Nonomuraea sp.]|nr:hypothetical protein [Nonomuraea sp.]